MKSRTGSHRDTWRRLSAAGIAGGALTAGLLAGVGAPTSLAQPAEPAVETEAPQPQAEGPRKPCTGDDCKRADEEKVAAAARARQADQVLSRIYEEYRQGDGGGQISVLIDDAVKLRKQGFRPSNANAAALLDALEHRPNQTPWSRRSRKPSPISASCNSARNSPLQPAVRSPAQCRSFRA